MVGRQLIGFFRQHRSQAKKGPAEWQKGGFELSISIFQIKCSMPLENTGSTKFFSFPIFFFPFFPNKVVSSSPGSVGLIL